MPIKRMFNQKAEKKVLDNMEKQTLRINALEVQLKSLLEFEKKIRTSMYSYNSGEKNEQEREKTLGKDLKIIKMENAHNFNEINKRLEEMGQRVQQLEKFRENKGHSQSIIEDHRQTSTEDFSTHEHKSEKRDDMDVFFTQIEMRVQLLERNILLVNEVQAGLVKRLEELIDISNGLVKRMDEAEVPIKNEEPILKTLYIEKLYLEKYEQNNNFAQLGIKSLSGALNIGATYGKEAIPKKITEQVKEEMEKMKEMKGEMENNQPSSDQSAPIHHDESSSEGASAPSEDKIPYTNIVIEEDDPSHEEDFF
ncbi:hypothetical protein P9D43_28525 [Neobacillus niacini]|uniref:hypothetical protein n=1 Tax=Neobacillus niacini TaxID=86668 RepID=UPI0007ABD7F5|nr:hypothetical protein [Neobacillus niacini]MEC1525948.1 hypothetical protein [Neobacillus niacini]